MFQRVQRSANVQLRLGDLLAKHLAAANMLGRAQIVKEVHRKTGKTVPIATTSRMRSHFDDDADLSLGFRLDLPAGDSAQYLRGLTSVSSATFDGLSSQYKKDAFMLSRQVAPDGRKLFELAPPVVPAAVANAARAAAVESAVVAEEKK